MSKQPNAGQRPAAAVVGGLDKHAYLERFWNQALAAFQSTVEQLQEEQA